MQSNHNYKTTLIFSQSHDIIILLPIVTMGVHSKNRETMKGVLTNEKDYCFYPVPHRHPDLHRL